MSVKSKETGMMIVKSQQFRQHRLHQPSLPVVGGGGGVVYDNCIMTSSKIKGTACSVY